MVVVRVPSSTASSTPVMLNGAEVVWPSGIVTVSGTVASVGSLVASCTVNSPLVSEPREIVAVVERASAEAAAKAEVLERLRESYRVSSV